MGENDVFYIKSRELEMAKILYMAIFVYIYSSSFIALVFIPHELDLPAFECIILSVFGSLSIIIPYLVLFLILFLKRRTTGYGFFFIFLFALFMYICVCILVMLSADFMYSLLLEMRTSLGDKRLIVASFFLDILLVAVPFIYNLSFVFVVCNRMLVIIEKTKNWKVFIRLLQACLFICWAYGVMGSFGSEVLPGFISSLVVGLIYLYLEIIRSRDFLLSRFVIKPQGKRARVVKK